MHKDLHRTTVWLYRSKRDRVIELSGVPFSEWLRDHVDAYIEAHEAIEAGRTQVDPTAIHGAAS